MPKQKRHARKRPPTFLILTGIVLLLIAVFASKRDTTAVSSNSLEAQLDTVLREKRSTLVFIHSLDCIPCKEMMDIVADVYPEFQDLIELIDVDVYDQNNQNILRRERPQSIPTLVFYDAQGTRQVYIGAMPSDQFRDVMTQLAAGQ